MINNIKYKILGLFRKSQSAHKSVLKYLMFILGIIGWVIILSFLIPISATLFATFGITNRITTSDFILLITAAFILAYTYETKKLREETVFQRKMSVANEVEFHTYGGSYISTSSEDIFGRLTTIESSNNTSKFIFVSAVFLKPIGECRPFYRDSESRFLLSDYYMSNSDRKEFLEALQIQNGEIKARILTTNGTKFFYTYRVIGENWQRILNNKEESNESIDKFILIKKELDETGFYL